MEKGSWHLRAMRLPDGGMEEWWVVDGRLSTEPVPGARDLTGGWFLPGGLVDAHAHLTMNFNGLRLPDGSDALIAANLEAQRAAGVLALRDAGIAWGGRPTLRPNIQSAGRIMAAPGRGYPNICAWAEADQLVGMALEDIDRGVRWIKVMGDFPGPDGNWFAAPPVYPADVLEALVRAAHDAGVRVMAHTTGLGAADLVRAGVDSIEHGMVLSGELLEHMARRGIAWSLTMSTAHMHVGHLMEQEGPVGAYVRGAMGRVRELLPLAASLGVALLAGTDELPHGIIAREVALLHEYGLTPTQAITAASTGARAFLGLPGFGAGEPADFITFTEDPRIDLGVLAQPAAIISHGVRVRSWMNRLQVS